MAKIVFFGTPDYVIPVLQSIKEAGYKIASLVTQPPKQVGREQIMTHSPVDRWAQKRKVKVLEEFSSLHSDENKADVGVLAAYGKIIPREIIDLFPHGILNIHPSLLPKHRGASPVQTAIASGERQTGVSIIRLDEKVDHGPIVAQFREAIKEDDTTGSLRARLFERAAEVLVTILPAYLEGRVRPREQDHERATFTKILKKEDGKIDWQKKDEEIERFIRAMTPWPGAWTLVRLERDTQNERRLKILKAHVEDGKLVPDQVQLEGKNPVSWKQFRQGYPTTKF